MSASERRVVRRYDPTLDGVDAFGCVEAKHLGVAERRAALLAAATERLGGIEDELKAVRVGDPTQRAFAGIIAPQRHTEDACRRGRDGAAHLLRVERVGTGIDFAEDRADPLPPERVRRRDEGERGNDHLALELERRDRQLQPDRGVADRDALPGSGDLSHSALEFHRHRAEVRQSHRIEHRLDAGEKTGAVGHVRTPNGDLFPKGWRTAQKANLGLHGGISWRVRRNGTHAILWLEWRIIGVLNVKGMDCRLNARSQHTDPLKVSDITISRR